MATYPYITFSCLGLRYYGWWASPPVAPSNGTSSRFLRSTMCCCYQASTKTCQSPATMVVAFLPGSNGPSVCIITCGGAVRRRRRRRRKHNCTRRRRSSNNNNNIMENAWHRWRWKNLTPLGVGGRSSAMDCTKRQPLYARLLRCPCESGLSITDIVRLVYPSSFELSQNKIWIEWPIILNCLMYYTEVIGQGISPSNSPPYSYVWYIVKVNNRPTTSPNHFQDRMIIRIPLRHTPIISWLGNNNFPAIWETLLG